MLAVLVTGVVLATGALRLGGAMVGRARAAADARATAESNDARLVTCACAGTEATVVVEVELPAFGVLGGTARGRARAEVRAECVLALPGCG
jgi:hypothetical protein